MMTSAMLERAQESALPIRNGAFVAVVGPSGAGKDTLIAHAKAALSEEPKVDFVRRVITRSCDGSTEIHDSMSDAEFVEAEKKGAFALSWEAHGLRYGIPSSVDGALHAGHVAIANLSRGALPALRERYANVAVVEVTADPEILASRLAGRGRETKEEILSRLARTIACETTGPAIPLDNSGPAQIAGDRLVSIIRKAMAFADISGAV
ncbi:MAG: phosphonate metabolism protein/1,5-bisphosphokinase (PRPP-forming) PhnN [Rhizobiaceae bacterium]|nr:phosphonate metabolism protein/1,5-bisphosphokinase (PRPP-forming) PhnN [Rhizobiaceae bacterium]